MLSFYLTLSYDCNYSEANHNQTEACATIGNAPDIPRIGTAFFRRRKDHKVCDQITAVCHNCSNISLCGRWRTRRIASPGARFGKPLQRFFSGVEHLVETTR